MKGVVQNFPSLHASAGASATPSKLSPRSPDLDLPQNMADVPLELRHIFNRGSPRAGMRRTLPAF